MLRPLTAADVPAVDALAAEAYGVGFEDAGAFAAKLAAGFGLVADVGGEVAGYGIALPWRGELPALQSRPAGAPDRAEYLHVHDICIAAQHRGTGIAQAVMRAFEGVAADLGLATLQCIAVHGAEVVWARLGWVPSGRPVPGDYPAGAVAMIRRLG